MIVICELATRSSLATVLLLTIELLLTFMHDTCVSRFIIPKGWCALYIVKYLIMNVIAQLL